MLLGLRQQPEMRFRLGAVVETEDSHDDAGVLGGHANGSVTAAKISLGVTVLFEVHLKGFLKIAYGSRHQDGAARELRAGFMNREAEFLGKFLDLVEIGGIGAIGVRELGARYVLEAGFCEVTLKRLTLCLRFRAKSQGDLDSLVRMTIVDQARTTDGLTFTAWNYSKVSNGIHKCSFVSGEQSGEELIATQSRTGREVQRSSRRSDLTRSWLRISRTLKQYKTD
jgi:hypothetical protein